MKSMYITAVVILIAAVSHSGNSAWADDNSEPVKIELKSEAFEHEAAIPEKYSCEGDDISPGLTWNAPPKGTVELALICDDPDAPVGVWTHWVLYSIPADANALAEDLPIVEETESGIMQGENSWGNIAYGGPCPPRDSEHRYFFKLYALDSETGLQPCASKKQLEKAMKGHIIGYGELMGTFKR